MDKWPALRLQRSKSGDIYCESVIATDEGWMFSVVGCTDTYLVEFDEDLWPPRCNCEDNYWRPEVLCKHIIYLLRRMGIDEDRLVDPDFAPTQKEIYDMLTHAPDIVGES